MHIEFCAKLNFLEGKYAIMQNIGFLLSWAGTPCRYVILWPCKKDSDFVEVLLARGYKMEPDHRSRIGVLLQAGDPCCMVR